MAIRAPRLSQSGSDAPVGKVFSLSDVSSKGITLPNRYALYAGQGFGKTSMLAYARSPIFLMSRGEDGLPTLINAGQVPETPHFPVCDTWSEAMSALDLLRTQEHPYKTLVIDTMNGMERMMHEHVCERDFGNDWGERGFGGFQRGYEVSLADWRLFLNKLDDLRFKGMTIFFLGHAAIRSFRNPTGADYDRYVPEMNKNTWGLTKGWLDAVFFGNFEVLVKQAAKQQDVMKKGKASDVSARILYTNSDNPTFDAKNRMGLPAEIEMGDSAKDAWANFATAVQTARKAAPAVEVAA